MRKLLTVLLAPLAAVILLLGLTTVPAQAVNVDNEDCQQGFPPAIGWWANEKVCLHVWVGKDADGVGMTIQRVSILANDTPAWGWANGNSLDCWNQDNVIKWHRDDDQASPYANIDLHKGDVKDWTPNFKLGSATRLTCAYRGYFHEDGDSSTMAMLVKVAFQQ